METLKSNAPIAYPIAPGTLRLVKVTVHEGGSFTTLDETVLAGLAWPYIVADEGGQASHDLVFLSSESWRPESLEFLDNNVSENRERIVGPATATEAWWIDHIDAAVSRIKKSLGMNPDPLATEPAGAK